MSNEDFDGHNPAAPWQAKEPSRNNAVATGADRSGVVRATIRDGQVISEEIRKPLRGSSQEVAAAMNAAQHVPYDYAVDARTGCRIGPSELTEDSIVYMHGASLTVAQARQAGWLSPAPNLITRTRDERSLNEAISNPYAENAPKAELHPDLKTDLLADRALDQDYSNLLDNTGGVEQQQAIQQIVENGAIEERTLGALATQLRVEPEQLQARIAPLMQAFEKQARAVLSEGGLDSEAVINWAKERAPNKLALAMNRQAQARNTEGYAELRQTYLETLADHSPALALNAELGSGITQYKDEKGRVIVRLATGETMEWRTALKAFGAK